MLSDLCVSRAVVFWQAHAYYKHLLPPHTFGRKMRKILITSALPYANGPIHIGHLVEYIQSDIWARFQRLQGNTCYFVCADDAHGTPIMLRAEQQGCSPEELVATYGKEHAEDFADFLIEFDQYHSTHSEENRILSEQVFTALKEHGHIHKRTIKQAYDTSKSMFLPDRYIKGRCPHCKAEEQYGDNCESCGATYNSPMELENPVSALSGERPIEKSTEHYFFDLPYFSELLQKWLQQGHLQSEVVNKLKEWFASGLKPWDISRDAPYFGFRIPGTEDKYFYVWLDAPIGYLASFRKLCDRLGLDFTAWLKPGADTELYHFIGKDIIYFHGLFWPAMLAGSGYRMPDNLFVHGFLTVNGNKMSKSRGTLVTARTYLQHLHPEYLRYYFAFRLDGSISDIDLNFDDFVQRVNSDLVGKLVNIASRTAKLLKSNCANQLGDNLDEPELFAQVAAAADPLAGFYENREYARAMRLVMELADQVNRYIDEQKPWRLTREPNDKAKLQAVCTSALNAFRQLVIYLTPVLPQTAERCNQLLRQDAPSWSDVHKPLLGHPIESFSPLLTRIQREDVDKLVAASNAATAAVDKDEDKHLMETISIEDFSKLDLRVALIKEAELVEGADRLLRLTLDLGESGQRTVLAGIRSAYDPSALAGRLTIVLANLAPRKMRFGTSEGMVLAAGGTEEDGPFLLAPDSGAKPGMKVS